MIVWNQWFGQWMVMILSFMIMILTCILLYTDDRELLNVTSDYFFRFGFNPGDESASEEEEFYLPKFEKYISDGHQSIKRPIDQTIYQTNNQSIKQSINQSVNQSTNQSTNQPTNQVHLGRERKLWQKGPHLPSRLLRVPHRQEMVTIAISTTTNTNYQVGTISGASKPGSASRILPRLSRHVQPGRHFVGDQVHEVRIFEYVMT